MSTITLPNIRVSSDLTVKVRLKDGGVAIDWSTLSNVRALIYSDAQRAMAGRCAVTVDAEDATLLVCQYAANKPQYIGVNRIVISATYLGEMKTYDKPALNFVRWTDDQVGEQITISDPDVEVEIEVEDVSSSILQEAVDAAFSAAERADEAAAAAEHMVDIHTGPAGKSPYIGENGNWFDWDETTHHYVDTEVKAKGDTGETPDITIGTVTTAEPGTPAAATMTGTPEAPVLNLTIPKGVAGDTPAFTVGEVTTGEPGTPVVVTITGTASAPVLNVTIPQGLQGNTGSSVAYPYELVNNRTTDDATKGLSAAEGKRLGDDISQLEHKVNSADLLVERQIDVASQAKRSYYLNLDTQTYGTTSTYKHCVVDLEGAKMVRIQAGAEEDAQIAFFTSFDIASSGGSAPMLPTYYTIPAGTTKEIVIPVGAVALYFYAGTSSTGYKYAPAKVVFIGASVDSIDEQLESGYIIPTVREASGIRIESTVAVASGNTIKFFPVKKDDVLVVDFTHSGTNFRQGFTSVTPGTSAEVTSYSAFGTAPTGRLRLTAPFDGFYCASDVTNGISVFSPKIIRKTLANEVLKDAMSIKAETVADYVNPLRQIDIMSLTKQGGGLNGAGCFSYGSTYKFILLPVSAGGRLRIVSAYGTEAILAWFNQLPESTTGNAFAPFVENTARFTVSGDETFTVPEGAMYLYIYLGSSPYGIAPTFVGYAQPLSSSSSAVSIDNSDNQTIEMATRRTARALSIGLKPLSYNLDENGWEIPQTLQQLNAIKKAKQLCNIKWTPKSSVPLPNGTASAGVQRTGVNYSSPVEFEKYVGVGVSFHTFMTALNNPYSLQYTENINDDDSTSIWGFTYTDGKGYAYYGTACNGFVCACLEMVIEYANNAYHGRLTDAMIVTPLVPQSVDFFQIGDIIDTNTHAIMIYGIQRDSDGNAVGFKTAESTSAYNGCIIKDYTREELVSKINLSGFIAYRYNELWKNWDYKPSPYVPIDDEPEQIITYNDDICTFAGDEASFRVGDLVVLNYNLSDSPSHNWTGIEVYKDDVLVDTYLLSAIDQDVLPVGQRGHALKLGTSLEAGKYKARLTDGENYSDYTKWEVLSVVSTVLEKDNECLGVTIEAESNAVPKYVMVGTMSGGSFTSLKARLLTDEEIESGHFDLYINGVGRDNPLYIRFIADGEYGRIRTNPEEI